MALEKKVNFYQGQIQGPFKARQELMYLIEEQCLTAPNYVKHLGIQSQAPGALVELTICGQQVSVEVGTTCVYEIGNTKVTSIKFVEDQDNNVVIDYTAILNEKDPENESTM